MKNIIVLLLILSNFLIAGEFDKYLKSEIRAEVYAQNLIEGGYYSDAQKFLVEAKEKYPESEALWMFSASTEYNLKNFDKAKEYIIKTLEINPMNEEAANYKQMILSQEEASENQVLNDLFDYLSDKGIDFLAIFLAFLGGEIIARRYAKCKSLEIRNIVEQYKFRYELDNSMGYKIQFALKNYFNPVGKLQFCTFLNILVIVVMAFTLLITFLLVQLLLGLELFTVKSFALMSSSELWIYVSKIFVVLFVLTIFFQIIFYIKHLEEEPYRVELELSEYLDKLVAENDTIAIYDILLEVEKLEINLDELMFDTLNEETKEKIQAIYNAKTK